MVDLIGGSLKQSYFILPAESYAKSLICADFQALRDPEECYLENVRMKERKKMPPRSNVIKLSDPAKQIVLFPC